MPTLTWQSQKCVVFPWTHRAVAGEAGSKLAPGDVVADRLKLRSTTDKSMQRLLPKGGPWGLFGWHTIPADADELIITEGEYDALAVRMATGRPTVSLPNGCRSLPIQLLPALEPFKRIILWMDDDVAGHEGCEMMALKLGLNRCWIVPSVTPMPGHDKGPKDANDALRQGYDLKEILASATPNAHKQVSNFKSFRHEVRTMFTEPNVHKGVVLPGMPHLQSLMKGHRKGELTILTGSTGVGKTTILSQLSLEIATQGVPTLWGSFEIRNPRLARTMMMQHAASLGITLSPDRPEHFDLVADAFERLPFHFMRFYGSSPVADVIDAMDYAVYVHDVQHVILDNLQFMLSGQNRASVDKFDIQDRAIETFRQFASQRNVHVTLVIHPRKESDNSSLGISSVFGSAKATQEADNVLIIQHGLPRLLLKPMGVGEAKSKGQGRPDLSQHGAYEDPIKGEVINTHFRTLEVRKNRWDGELGAVALRFDKATNRLFELSKHDIQLGLSDFINSQVKLRQMELVSAMNQSEDAASKRKPTTSGGGGGGGGGGAGGSMGANTGPGPGRPPSPPHSQGGGYGTPTPAEVGSGEARLRPPPMHKPSLDIVME